MVTSQAECGKGFLGRTNLCGLGQRQLSKSGPLSDLREPLAFPSHPTHSRNVAPIAVPGPLEMSFKVA